MNNSGRPCNAGNSPATFAVRSAWSLVLTALLLLPGTARAWWGDSYVAGWGNFNVTYTDCGTYGACWSHFESCAARGFNATLNPGFQWNGRGYIVLDYVNCGQGAETGDRIRYRNQGGGLTGGYKEWNTCAYTCSWQPFEYGETGDMYNWNGVYLNADESWTTGCGNVCGYARTAIREIHQYGDKWVYLNDWIVFGGYGSGSISDTANRSFPWAEAGLYAYPFIDGSASQGKLIVDTLFGGRVPYRVTTGDCGNAGLGNYLNFKGNAGQNGNNNCDNCDAYAFAWCYAPGGAGPMFGIGSDDGARVWLNGNLFHDNNAYRGVTWDQDRTAAQGFSAGWNRILFKVHNGGGGFGGVMSLHNGGDFRQMEPSVNLQSDRYGGYSVGYEQNDWYPRLFCSNANGVTGTPAAGLVSYGNNTTVTASGTASANFIPFWTVMITTWGYNQNSAFRYVTSPGTTWSDSQTGITGHVRLHYFAVSRSGRHSGQASGSNGNWTWNNTGNCYWFDAYVDNVAPVNPSFSGVNVISTTQINLGWGIPLDRGAGGVADGVDEATAAVSGGNNYYRRGDVGVQVYRNGSVISSWGTGTSKSDTGLAPNTAYTYTIEARDNTGEARGTWHNSTGQQGSTVAWTLPAPPTTITVTRSGSFFCQSNVPVTWTAVGGFGAGKIEKYKYAWDQSPTHSWTGSEPDWASGTLSLEPTDGGNWYLHLMSYNGNNVPNNATLDYPVVVVANGTEKWVAGSGQWDMTTPGRWQDATPNAITYCDGHHVLFDDSGCGEEESLPMQATATPTNVVNGTAKNDPILTDKPVSSAARLTKQSGSTLSLNPPQNYPLTTTVNEPAGGFHLAGDQPLTATGIGLGPVTTDSAVSLLTDLGITDGPLTPSLSPSEGERVPFRAGEGFRGTMREPVVREVLTPSAGPAPETPASPDNPAIAGSASLQMNKSGDTPASDSDASSSQSGDSNPQRSGLSESAQPKFNGPIAALEALALPESASASGQGLELGVLPGTKILALQTEGDTTTVEFSQDILGREELGTKLDEARLTAVFDQVRATLRQCGLEGNIRLQAGGKLLHTYLPPVEPVEPGPAPKATAPIEQAGKSLNGKNICIGPSHGRFWNGSGWYWQRTDPCGYGEAVLEDLNSIRLMQFLYQYLAQDGATVHVPRELNESNCCNGYEGLAWWKMAAYSWLRANGLPCSVWASYTGNCGAENAVGRSSDDIRARPLFADYRGSDIYIAHHTNAGGGTGTETFRDTAMEHPAHEEASYNLALAVHNNTIDAIRDMYDGGWANRGVKDGAGNYGEIRIPNRPACLIELAFHDKCAVDAAYLTDDFFRSVAQWGLYKGVCAYFGTSPTWDKYSDQYVSDTIPSTMTAGQSYSVSVTFRNRGVLWREGRAFRLGAAGDSDPFTSTTRHTISGDVRPGNTYTFTFTMTAPTTPGTYTTDWRMVRDGVAWFGETHSEQVSVISTAPTITTQPASVTKDPGQTATFTVVASSSTTPSYQWRKNGVNISGATSSTLTLANVQLSDAAFYTVVVSNAGGSVTSSQAQLVVTGSPVAAGTGDGLQGQYFDNQDLTSPVLTRTDTTINFAWGEGSPDASIAVDTFSVRWTGQVVPRYSQDYTFYTRTDDGVRLWVNNVLLVDKWIDQSPTEWSGTIALTAGQAYDIKMEYYENSGGATAQLSWSSASEAKATIPQTQLYVSASPLIVVQPQNQSVVVGNGATFTVTAQGVLPLTYQWRFNGADISGATLSRYTKATVQPADAGTYSVVVANTYGSIVSSGATLTVLLPPSITTQPSSQAAYQDGVVSFSVAATGTAPLTYQWRFNGADISGATLSSYTKSNVQPADAGAYSVVVANAYGSTTSANALLTVTPSPTITTQPLTQLAAPGAVVYLTVAATGTGPLTYQWRRNGVDLSDGGIFSGVTTPTLTLTGVQRTDSGTYSVLVSNPNRSVASVDALLTVSCLGNSIAVALDMPVLPTSVTNKSVLDYTISGTGKISGSAWLTKEGSSTLTLSTINDYTGPTTVSGGALLVNGAIGSGAVTVEDTGTLGGNGAIGGNITVESGGLLAPGASIGTVGTLTVGGGNVTLKGGSITAVEVNRAGPVSDRVTGIGTLTQGGILQVANTGEALEIGDSFQLLSATTYSGEFAQISPANPNGDEELAWDRLLLKTNGVLRVHHVPFATDKVLYRAQGVSLKIRLNTLFPAIDPLDYESVALASHTAGSQGAGISNSASYLFYYPVNHNHDSLNYTVSDDRGGERTKEIKIYVTDWVGSVTIVDSGNGPQTVSFYGIPGYEYIIQRSPDLAVWTDIKTQVCAPDGLYQFTETPPYSPTFYRARTP